jgi:hypothetical protein
MTGRQRPQFGVGAVLELAEADYMYGVGTLALRLTKVTVDPASYRRMEWINVEGLQLYPNGATGEARYVTIRVDAIKAALRPNGWLPPEYTTPPPLRRRDRS